MIICQSAGFNFPKTEQDAIVLIVHVLGNIAVIFFESLLVFFLKFEVFAKFIQTVFNKVIVIGQRDINDGTCVKNRDSKAVAL
ncbi:MAG TPA: hypothetical protein DCS54_05995 [Oribacterium sp.]|nr:hypothetical protein [Oribacterium sp.]